MPLGTSSKDSTEKDVLRTLWIKKIAANSIFHRLTKEKTNTKGLTRCVESDLLLSLDFVILENDMLKAVIAKSSGAVEIDGINYEPCDEVVANSIRDGTDTAVLDASAILIVSMEDLNWELLAESYVRQEVGFIMEVINYVAGNVVFNDHIVDKFRKDNGLRKSFGSRVLSVQDSQGFLALADKWDLDLRVPPRILKKVVLDLIG